MQFRRRHAAAVAGLGAIISMGITRPHANAAITLTSENSLLGVRLLDSYKSVLQRFGQPAEVQVGVPVEGAGGAGGMGGGPGSGGPMGMPGGGEPMGGPMGMPSSGGPMGMPGGGGPTLPGFGRPGGMPGSGGMGAPGGAAPGAAGAANAEALPTLPGSGNSGTGPSEETVMWYKFPQQGLFYSFLFNKQGQVIQIQAYGYKPDPKVPFNARTAKGIALGSSMGSVLKNYGWSSDGEHIGDFVVLRYDSRNRLPGGHGKLALQIQHNQVVGITLGYVK